MDAKEVLLSGLEILRIILFYGFLINATLWVLAFYEFTWQTMLAFGTAYYLIFDEALPTLFNAVRGRTIGVRPTGRIPTGRARGREIEEIKNQFRKEISSLRAELKKQRSKK